MSALMRRLERLERESKPQGRSLVQTLIELGGEDGSAYANDRTRLAELLMGMSDARRTEKT